MGEDSKFYSKYSNYSPNQLFESDYYQDICDIFERTKVEEETKRKMLSILYEGGVDDYSINIIVMNQDDPGRERQRRVAYAYLIATHPETFDYLKDNYIQLFHGTNSNALPNILKYGLNSFNKSKSQNIEVRSGEASTRSNGRSFVSLTNDLDIASSYATIGTSDGRTFPVVLGISTNKFYGQKRVHVTSDIPEVGVKDGIPKEDIGFIGVPEDKLEFVRKMVGDRAIVFPIDRFKDKFYYVDESGCIEVIQDKVPNFINRTKTNVFRRLFSKADLDDLANTRTRSGTKSIFDKLKDTLKGKKRHDVESEVSYEG